MLRVRLPSMASAGQLTIIETVNQPGFGPPLHRRRGEFRSLIEGRQQAGTGGQHGHAAQTAGVLKGQSLRDPRQRVAPLSERQQVGPLAAYVQIFTVRVWLNLSLLCAADDFPDPSASRSSSSDASVAVSALRPPPGRRMRSASSGAIDPSSLRPRPIVLAAMPVACDTAATPP